MSNTYFEFKQFRVDQDQAGMKVTTDACILGGIVAKSIHQGQEPKSILDIGAGTGLLSLMLAHTIDAIELSRPGYLQACENFKNSPWIGRLNCHHIAVQDYIPMSPTPDYDLIISNPPFFKDNQKTGDKNRNTALHNETLSFSELATAIDRLISTTGQAIVMYPVWEMNLFTLEMKKLGLNSAAGYEIWNKVDSQVIRKVMRFDRVAKSTSHHQLVIRQSNNDYTEAFKSLLLDYNLHL